MILLTNKTCVQVSRLEANADLEAIILSNTQRKTDFVHLAQAMAVMTLTLLCCISFSSKPYPWAQQLHNMHNWSLSDQITYLSAMTAIISGVTLASSLLNKPIKLLLIKSFLRQWFVRFHHFFVGALFVCAITLAASILRVFFMLINAVISVLI